MNTKESVVARVGVGRDKRTEHRGFLGQWNYSVHYYNDGNMSLYFL